MTWRRQGQEGGLSTCPPAPEEQGEPSGLIARKACGRQDGELVTRVPRGDRLADLGTRLWGKSESREMAFPRSQRWSNAVRSSQGPCHELGSAPSLGSADSGSHDPE